MLPRAEVGPFTDETRAIAIARADKGGGKTALLRLARVNLQKLPNAIVLGSTAGSIGTLARGLWQTDNKRWLLPLAVFLCVTGLLLILATTVEALAPFIYSIF